MSLAVRVWHARRISTSLAVCMAGATLSGPAASDADPARQATISGTLSVFQEDDFERNRSRRIYQIRDSATGKDYQLDFAVAPDPRLVTGST